MSHLYETTVHEQWNFLYQNTVHFVSLSQSYTFTVKVHKIVINIST